MAIVRDKAYYEQWRRSHGIQPREEWVASVRKPGFCSDCKRFYPLNAFNKHSKRPNGIQHICKACQAERHKDWRGRMSPEAKETIRLQNNSATKKYRRDPANRIKLAAHQMVAAALKIGILTVQPCKECGLQPADAHHEDHTKPLEVIWLCRSHHKSLHHRS